MVAHPDDDLLFTSPDLLHAVEDGWCVRTVVMTAGDAGLGEGYWQGREAGHRAAYAAMAGVPDEWELDDAGVPGHPMPLFTLVGQPQVSLVYMRLPDGNLTGTGFAATGNVGLTRLWIEEIPFLGTMDDSSLYTDQELKDALGHVMTTFEPGEVRTLNFDSGAGDHPDHHAAALYTREAHLEANHPGTLTGYLGYPTSTLPANVAGPDLGGKQHGFYTYAGHDDLLCSTPAQCAGTVYDAWLQRQYPT